MIDANLLLERLLWTTVQGSVLLALVWFVTSRVGFDRPRLRSLLWSLAFLHFLAGLFISVPVPILPASEKASIEMVSPRPAAAASATPLSAATPVDGSERPFPWLAWAWAGTIAAGLGVLAYREARFRIGLKGSSVPCERLQEKAERVAAEVGLRRAPQVRITEAIKSPCVTGVLRPCIFWPAALHGVLDETREDAVLAHEMIHVRNGDIAVGWLAAIVRCLFFFNPLLWVARREFGIQSELLCDQEVLRVTRISKKSYCDLLIDLAAKRPFPPATVYSATRDFKVLSKRIDRMSRHSKRQRGAASFALIGATAIAIIATIPVTVTQRPVALLDPDKHLFDAIDALEPQQAINAEDVPTIVIDPDQIVSVEVVDDEPIGDAVLDAKVTLSFKDTPAGELLKAVTRQTGTKIDAGAITDLKFTITANDMRLRTLLHVLAKQSDVPYRRISDREFAFDR